MINDKIQNFYFHENPIVIDLPVYNRWVERGLKRALKESHLGAKKTAVTDKKLPYYCFYTMKFTTAGVLSAVLGSAAIYADLYMQEYFDKEPKAKATI